MKILWVCNSLPLEVIEKFDLKNGKPESWITGIHNKIKTNSKNELIFMFPESRSKQKIEWISGNTHYISYPEKNFFEYNKKQEQFFCYILKKYSPDVIHIFGTEYPHTLAIINACETEQMLEHSVISIQGMVSVIAQHYDFNLPFYAKHFWTLRDFLKLDNIYYQKKKMHQRGIFEIAALKKAKHVIGRTDWDYACTKRINPNIQYHFCNETLRDQFYVKKWNVEQCERQSIFLSQCNYSVKGMHFLLENMKEILKIYPHAHLYTTGPDLIKTSFIQRQKRTYYSSYLAKLIKKYDLINHVTFLGELNEEEMCNRYLKSNVFVCCSTIENSSNSVGEAMILGVPIVASDVGGIKNLMKHEEDGYIYPSDEPYMLPYYISKIFDSDIISNQISTHAKRRAAHTHDAEKNFKDLIEIYNKISKT